MKGCARLDAAAKRAAWRADQPGLNPARLVFIDETWATTNMGRRFGRCPRGRRLIAAVPHGHWKTSTFVAASRASGPTAPGHLLIMDNLAAHKVVGVRDAIEARRAVLLYLPPYSPDLNPIEQALAKLRALLRKTAARSIEALWSAIGDLIPRFPPHECRNCLANSGYGPANGNPL